MRATAARDGEEETFPTRDVLRRIYAQRAQRYVDPGPDLGLDGAARYRLEGSRLQVAFAQIAPAAFDDATQRITRYARERGQRVVWTFLRELTAEDALARALLARGFQLDERLILMARQDLLAIRSFYDDPTPDDALVTARASERWRQQELGWFRFYTAAIDSMTAGGLYVSLWEDIPTLMGVYTLERARERGLASETLRQAIADLVASGRDIYCLFVKDVNPARDLYHQLGFQVLSVEETYILDP